MTLTELQVILGERINKINDESISPEERKKEAELSQVISSLAKQMINNADVVLRSVKFVADYKLEDSTVKDMVSGKYLLMKKGDDGTIEGKTL